MFYIFFPLCQADRFLWHTTDLADSGRYPINLAGELHDAEDRPAPNWSQPIRSETNRVSSAAGSRR